MYAFDGNEARSPGTISLPVRRDLCNVITEFYMAGMKPPTMRYPGDFGST